MEDFYFDKNDNEILSIDKSKFLKRILINKLMIKFWFFKIVKIRIRWNRKN